ncbi:alpha-glucuronidase family glycosyl hydrolase [Microbulbifer bruguierae]|uniref:Xylan alpha-1,2-glucuronidase n=1 Tax=Microbulbifer bruguierae TaxID=3029061 RepID=A0ABY8NHF1_9GAMM|nr:alpha-glucuronidase family glycosyl hydrolase [Microbulbifer bruguierae]WGL18356.1 alpha-glucuronidase family glycosyl hydrolase [Microbulbifer bruguierae]
MHSDAFFPPRTLLPFSVLLFSAFLFAAAAAKAEDGYDLWLRYQPLEQETRHQYRPQLRQLLIPGREQSPALNTIASELVRGVGGLLERAPAVSEHIRGDGFVLVATPQSSPLVRAEKLPLKGLGDEGYLIRSVKIRGHQGTVITANSERGLLYGGFHFLRLLQTRTSIAEVDISGQPRIGLRLLNHWDNLDRTVERGYAGQSIWDWWNLPDVLDPRYTDYARANAAIGINGTVLNNVNASADSLTPRYLAKAAALAEVFRPYGIRVYLSARFSAPVEIGGLTTADPKDPEVQRWWQGKADEIYRLIPDFGGFLVKANSEGQPGPQDYGRSHAEGANLLARALKPRGGVVMWRAFVYQQDNPEDRAKQAYSDFVPLDGQFDDNVIVQVKNGPIDFQPREPFHPMFGAMAKTPLMMEFQITKEYLGFASHLAYLGPMYEEVLKADTFARGAGSTVTRVVDGSLYGHRLTGIAGVANIGSDRDWSGSTFNQANWYVFGRMAWNPDLSAEEVARDWLKITFSNNPTLLDIGLEMMLASRQAVVDYMTPLGLAHLMATGHHYGPGPWVSDLARPEWNPAYYHRADRNGIGFDRTGDGSNAVAQYAAPVAARFASRSGVGDDLLLWFHHLPWDYPVASGRDLWGELVYRYDRGVATAQNLQDQWHSLENHIDPERFDKTARLLAVQAREAKWWRDASVAYFQSVSGRRLPAGSAQPSHSLEYYQQQQFPWAPGH